MQTDIYNPQEIRCIEDFVASCQLKLEAFIKSSNINLSWRVMHHNEKRPFIFSLGPKLSSVGPFSSSDLKGISYLDPKKYIKAKAASKFAKKFKVVCPNIRASGYDKKLQRAWIIQEYAIGTKLYDVWDSLSCQQKKEVTYKTGQMLALLHSNRFVSHSANKFPFDISSSSYAWYKDRIYKTMKILQEMKVFSEKEIKAARTAIELALKRVTLGKLRLIHGDILHKNIFIGQSQANPQQWEISSFIDWETAMVGDPFYDIVLCAWWLSGKLGLWQTMKGSSNLFYEVIKGYNDSIAASSSKFELKQTNEILLLADLSWYLSVFPFIVVRSSKMVIEKRKQKIMKIIEACAKGEAYFNKYP